MGATLSVGSNPTLSAESGPCRLAGPRSRSRPPVVPVIRPCIGRPKSSWRSPTLHFGDGRNQTVIARPSGAACPPSLPVPARRRPPRQWSPGPAQPGWAIPRPAASAAEETLVPRLSAHLGSGRPKRAELSVPPVLPAAPGDFASVDRRPGWPAIMGRSCARPTLPRPSRVAPCSGGGRHRRPARSSAGIGACSGSGGARGDDPLAALGRHAGQGARRRAPDGGAARRACTRPSPIRPRCWPGSTALDATIRADFAEGRTVLADGWLLSRHRGGRAGRLRPWLNPARRRDPRRQRGRRGPHDHRPTSASSAPGRPG